MYSLRNERSIEEAKTVCAMPRNFSKIEVMSRATNPNWRKELEGIAEMHADVMHTLIPLSPRTRGSYGPALDDDALMQRIRDTVSYGKSLGAENFNLSLLDVSRTESVLLERAVKTAVDAGADRICIADTVGCFTPEVTQAFIRQVRQWIPRPIKLRVHMHNDFGLATANALAAAAAGADMIDTCVNGRGKRAGNADMVQVVMGLKAFYGLDCGIHLNQLYPVCKEIERLSGIPIPTNAPFTGDLVFADDSEAHVKGNREESFAFQAIDPEDWGNPRRVLVGKNSGTYTMAIKLEQLGLSVPEEKTLEQILNACIKESDTLPRGAFLTDQAVTAIYKKVIG